MVNARLRETARQAFFSASPRHFDSFVQTLKIRAPDIVES